MDLFLHVFIFAIQVSGKVQYVSCSCMFVPHTLISAIVLVTLILLITVHY